MIIDELYIFERIATKAKTRLDCTASTGGYKTFEEKRITKATRETAKRDANRLGGLTIRISSTVFIDADSKRKADVQITMGSDFLTSIFVPDIEKCCGYGDAKNTCDALLILLHNFSTANGKIAQGAKVEIFVSRGQAHNCGSLYNLWSDGELDKEIEALRKAVKPEIDSPEKQ